MKLDRSSVVLIALLLGLSGWMYWQQHGNPLAPAKPALVVIVHRSETALPPYAMGAVNELRAAGRDVRIVDDEPANGLNAVPAAVAPAVTKAREVGHPALVLLDGERVVGAIKLPASKEAILEAAQ